jgi:hypothetical protein
MREPLTLSQQRLRGRKVSDMKIDQLRDWLNACEKMSVWVKPPKARRSWAQGLKEAEEELEQRCAHD